MEKILSIDKLFKSYNYALDEKKSNETLRIYTLRYGMYNAVEFIYFGETNPEEDTYVIACKRSYSEIGFATNITKYKDIDMIEEYLFEGFFLNTPLGIELKSRYKNFVNKQVKNLPPNSKYQYINSPYDASFQNKNGATEILNTSNTGIIDNITKLLINTQGALLVIIEAPAGFGKTCTANEILNVFSLSENRKLPFFTELSRNREARIFKHILLNEIDEQFSSGIKQNTVIEQIHKGRIPLIIDGFDELLSKESQREEVESMLSTIIELLKEKSKIIITSRKTAIFDSEAFFDLICNSNEEFSLARFEIKNPTIENWLEDKRLEIINKNRIPISKIGNPVLLSYLKNISFDKFTEYLQSKEETIIDRYFDYLLNREKERQNINLSKEEQLNIFRKLCRLMVEYNITAEGKSLIKDFIKDFNIKILQDSLNRYKIDNRPTIEELVDILSNHVLLDRKMNNNIGFLNDFILGYLIAENLVLGKFQEHYSNFTEIISEDFALKSIESFRFQTSELKTKLWDVYNSFNLSNNFHFCLDLYLKKYLQKNYRNLAVSNEDINEVNFDHHYIEDSVFCNVVFNSCVFNPIFFKKTSFQGCTFNNCNIEVPDNFIFNFEDFGFYGCISNNEFINKTKESIKNTIFKEEGIKTSEIELYILKQFFQVDGKRPRSKKISSIKPFPNASVFTLGSAIDDLKQKNLLILRGDLGSLTKEGIDFFNKHK